MLNPTFSRKIALAFSIFCFAIHFPVLGQGSPDIIWKQQVNIDRVNSVIFTPDGQTVISGGSDRLIHFWRASDGVLMQTLNTNAPFVHESAIEWLSISRDASLLASCSYKLIQLWDLPSGTMRRLNGHTDWVVAVAFSPAGNFLASASFDTTVRIWNPTDGSLIKTITGTGQQRCVAFSPDGSLLAAASGANVVRVFRTSDWTLVNTLTGHTDDVFTCAFSPDGSMIASGGYDDSVKLWNVADGLLKYTFSGNGGNIYGLAFTSDGSKLAYTDGEGNTVKIYSTADGALLRKFTDEVNNVQTVAFSPDGLLAYGRVDTTVVLARITGSTSARITSPSSGRIYNSPANIAIAAAPSKNDGSITKMEFFQNGTKIGEDLAPPFSFTWTAVGPGTYTLTAVDTDNLGATTTSGPVTINVVDQTNTPPTPPAISITSPRNNATFSAGSAITISASATAGAGIATVEFFQNGFSLGEATRTPFSFRWDSVPTGNYSLTAIVTDNAGATATASPIDISVSEASPETVKPQVTITSPEAGARLSTRDMLLTGSASDNVGVAQVLYSLNGAPFVAADGAENWESTITLEPGENLIQVKSVDVTGNESIIVSRKFSYIISGLLSLQINGLGTIRPLRDGQSLEVGKTYSISAVPARDQVFDGWTGSIVTNAIAFSFTMISNMNFTATFVPNPFAAVKGTYAGLVQPSTPNHERTGFFQMKTTSSGGFSGKIIIGGKNHSLRGKFTGDGKFSGTNPESGLDLRLQLDLTNGTDQITGSLFDGISTAAIVADRSVFSNFNPAPQAGSYTILIPPNPAQPDSPQGNGFGILKVATAGTLRISGALADGTPYTQSTFISKNSTWPFYVASYRSQGSISGSLKFRDQPGVSDLDGAVNWFRASSSTAKIFAGGFDSETTLIGSGYTKPSGAPVLSVPAGEGNVLLNFGDGNLESELQHPATLEANNKFVINQASNEKIRVSISAVSGSLKGSFVHPVTGRPTNHRGVVFQKQNLAEGYFLGDSQAGFVSVVPADESSRPSTPPPDDVIPIPDPILPDITPTEPIPKKRKGHSND